MSEELAQRLGALLCGFAFLIGATDSPLLVPLHWLLCCVCAYFETDGLFDAFITSFGMWICTSAFLVFGWVCSDMFRAVFL